MKKNKKENILYIIILIIFIGLTTMISLKHEYWADEANAWLIAKDSTLIELFTKYLHTDGHPALFHLIIKFFQLFGLPYEGFRVIALLFSSLGVAFFLFKSNFKWYIKTIIPFTYFIFYQYTVITRGYCLILLLLSIIAILWQKRKEKCFLFSLFLILLLSLESYTFLIAGSIYLIFIIDYIKDFLKTKKHNKKHLICLIIIFLSFLITTIYVLPRGDNTFFPRLTTYYISDSFVTVYNASKTIKTIFSLAFFIFFFLLYKSIKDNKIRWEAAIIITPLLLYMEFGYCNLWHIGIFFLLILFLAWIHNLNQIKIFNIVLIISCFIQIYWSINSSIYDYKSTYSPAKDAAIFLKRQDYQNKKIVAHEFYETAINAYFDKNIFDNWHEQTRFFYWNTSNKYYDYSTKPEDLVKQNVDIYIVTPLYENIEFDKIRENYDEYIFKGSTYFETFKYENMDAYIYIKKDNQEN